jgi:hypothetical protein
MPRYPTQIEHSEKYHDEKYEYKHVTLNEETAKKIKSGCLVSYSEFQKLGIIQTPGWIHYFSLPHEKHVLFMKRPLGKN